MRSARASRIGDILVKGGVVDASQLQLALEHCERRGGRLAQAIAEMGLASEDRIVDTLARVLRVERFQLGALAQDPNALARLEASYAEERAVFPVALKDDGRSLVLAMADPCDLDTVDDVQRRARARVIVGVASEREIKAAIFAGYYGRPQFVELSPMSSGEHPGEITTLSGEELRAGRRPPPEPPGHRWDDVRPRSRPPSAPPASPGSAWGEDVLRRLRTLQEKQESSSRVVRAIAELLMEKGRLTAEELRRRLSQQ
jgi:hypothetical protein